MFIIQCPHCGIHIEILELNCKIFRCGVFKKDFRQIDPHASKKMCDLYAESGLIYGCGKPFTVSESGIAAISQYI